jgi:hypothetical protein
MENISAKPSKIKEQALRYLFIGRDAKKLN